MLRDVEAGGVDVVLVWYHTRGPHFTTSLLWGDYRIIHPPQSAVYA